MSTEPTPARKAGRAALALLKRRWGTLLVAAVTIAGATPILELAIGTHRATECLAGYEAPRGPTPPDCGGVVEWFVLPSRVPWTLHSARYRAEELGGRIRIAGYLDAIVGHPDRKALEHAAEDVDAAAKTLSKGSQRLALEELGSSVGAPDLGKYADAEGDRATLLRGWAHWADWPVQLHTLQAALVEGDVSRALEIAKRYAEFDPNDEDLRTAVGAMLCLGDAPKRGIELLRTVQDNRAAQRHAAMARNYGDIRALIVACAALAKVSPPPKPIEQAGQADAVAARAVLRVKLAPAESQPEALDAALTLLHGPIKAHGGRLALLAEVLGHKAVLAPELAAELARPHLDEGEGPLGPSGALTLVALLDEPPGIRPVATVSSMLDAAGTLVELSSRAGVTPEVAATLREAAGTMLLEAGSEIARSGKAEEAAKAMRLGGEIALADPALRALARSSAFYLGGDAVRALAELTSEPDDLARPFATRAAIAWQSAELLASLGKRKEAADAAVAADALGEQAGAKEGARAVDVYTRWTRLALTRASGHPLRRDPSGSEGFRWIGFAEITAAWARPDAPNERAIAETLGAWARAVTLAPEGRRALRYEAFHHRGDAPPAHVAFLTLGADLLGEGQGDVELWLDALDAVDARRTSLRAYAWNRAEAARWRGDAESAKKWSGRFRTLAALAADPGRAEIARHLGI